MVLTMGYLLRWQAEAAGTLLARTLEAGDWCQWNIKVITWVIGTWCSDWTGMLYTSRGIVTTCLLTLMLHLAWGYTRPTGALPDFCEVGTLDWCQDSSWQHQLFFIGIFLLSFQGKALKCSLDGILHIRFQNSQLTYVFQTLKDAWTSPWYRLHC